MKCFVSIGLLAGFVLATVGCEQHGADVMESDSGVWAVSNVIDGVKHVNGDWNPMLPAGERGRSWGNHRAVIDVSLTDLALPTVVRATIPWRRHDLNPADKAVVVVDSATGLVVQNSLTTNITNESGDVWFEPVGGPGAYFAYYFPYWTSGSYYPRVTYLTPDSLSATHPGDPGWVSMVETLKAADVEAVPRVNVSRIESINAFHSFFPMEVIATDAEVQRFSTKHPKPYYLFPEYRERPIRMRRYLPAHWVASPAAAGQPDGVDMPDAATPDAAAPDATTPDLVGDSVRFRLNARRGEYFTFQIGVYSPESKLEDVRIRFEDLVAENGASLAASTFTCFNLGGVDLAGKSFVKRLDVDAGDVQALWIGVEVPASAVAGHYIGKVTVAPGGIDHQSISLDLEISNQIAEAGGDNEPEKMSRLRWLNSSLGADPEFIVAPFTPVEVSGNTIGILGRDVVLGPAGLPSSIRSYFTEELTGISDEASDILAQPLSLEVLANGRVQSWSSEPYRIALPAAGRAEWHGESQSDLFQLLVKGTLEYDGMLDYRISLIPKVAVDVADIQLPVVMPTDAATYMLGLGRTGGRRENTVDWKWKVENHQEGVWLGGINKGLQYVLRDENYERPLNTNFYLSKPLNLPPSWYNSGRGGIRISTIGDQVVARNYSGERKLVAGDTLHFNIRFLITPFKPIDTAEHFNTRFVHKYVPVDSVKAWGGTVVNIHHANEINPYINYPFYNLDLQTAYIEEAHRKDVKVKLYYTIRELTYRAHELFPMRSLGYEIFNDGDGGGHPWLQEHLQSNYHSAWHAWSVDDAAILNKGTSRWTNYYVEGLNWLALNQKIDGLYLDDIAFSRETVKRMVTVLDTHRDGVVIDLHSANQFNKSDGFINSAMLYMEHFPFISRLWFGEYFDYDADPDYWMTEVSGLPFGLMGEMLQDCGRPYRGMLYGMTTRMYGDCDPRPMWNLFNTFEIAEARMLGYWLENSPVKTDNPKVLATSYVRNGKTLVTLASWADTNLDVQVTVDWKTLGMDASSARIRVPEVTGLQTARTYSVTDPLPVPAGQGLFFILE